MEGMCKSFLAKGRLLALTASVVNKPRPWDWVDLTATGPM